MPENLGWTKKSTFNHILGLFVQIKTSNEKMSGREKNNILAKDVITERKFGIKAKKLT